MTAPMFPSSAPTAQLASLLFAACLAAACTRRDAPPPNIDGLSDALRTAAETRLPTPTLAGERITLRLPAEKLAAEEKRIVELATRLGGTAVRSTDSEPGVKLLVQIPGGSAVQFVEQVGGSPPRIGRPPADESELFEITISPSP